MPKASGVPAASHDAALRAFADALAPYLAPHFDVKPRDEVSYFSQYDSPLGRKRHLELVRTGALPGNKVGRLVLVRREHVRTYIEQGAAHVKATWRPRGGHVEATCDGSGGQAEAEQAELLADWGLIGRGYR
jgi:hypothetical protein